MVMGMTLVRTAYGREAALALRDAVARAKDGDPLAPVTVVVPSNHVGVATRRLLSAGALGPVAGRGTGIAAVTLVTPYRLAELLGAARLAAEGKRPLSTPVLAAGMRASLAEQPGLFEPVAEHPATESALVNSYRELRDLSDAALDAVAATSARAREVVRLHRSTRARLEARWSDEQDLLRAAVTEVRAGGGGELGPVVVHLPERLSQHAADLLRAVADCTPTTVVAATIGIPEADAEVDRSLERLGVASAEAPDTGLDTSGTEIVTASDADEEVRAAVRAVVDAVRDGTRLDRIALLHASPEPYARLAHEQLAAAGLPTNGAAVLPLSARVAGRTLLDLLALPAGGFRRQDVFAWLAAAPILHGRRLAPVTAWERLSRDASVVAGRSDWDRLLTQLADQDEARATEAEADDEEPEWRVERLRSEARRARELRTFALRVIDDLAGAAARPRAWSEHAEWARGWLHRLLGSPDRRRTWTDLAEVKAAERVERALDRLAALDDAEGPVPLEVFTRTLTLELDDDLQRVGRFGEGVLVGSVEMGVGLDLDLVVVLGLAEGSFPATVRDDSLLPDRERGVSGGELPLRADRVERQHRHLLAALAGARRHLLGVPRGDLRRSADRVPSRWVLDIASARAGERWWSGDLLAATVPWVRHVASFDHGLRLLTVPATEQEHRLCSLLASGGDLHRATDPGTVLGAEVIAERRSHRFTRFDGNLGGLDVPSPIGGITSPTRLERWASCPHQHLVEDLLRAAPVENPEDVLMITALDKGSLVHDALEHFLKRVLARPESERPGRGEPWSPTDHALLQEIGAACCDRYEAMGLVGRPIFWARDRRRILGDLEATLLVDSAHRLAHGTAPLAAELAFGFVGESLPAVEVLLPDGRRLRVRGRIDRIDIARDGTVHVIDYKTGRSRSYDGLSADDPVAGGTKLQLPLYGLAGRLAVKDPAAAVRAEYWFVTDKGEFKRVGYDVTDDVLEQAGAVLGEIVAGIEAGVFAPHPAETSTYAFITCHTCNPDGLGTAELRKQWDRKRHDPALARYAELAEPLEPVA
jgi:ATP-dependent helicase/nuclease subunit B